MLYRTLESNSVSTLDNHLVFRIFICNYNLDTTEAERIVRALIPQALEVVIDVND